VSLRVSIALALGLWASGCGEDGPLVPFKLKGKGAGEATTTGGPAPEAEPTEGTSYPAQTGNVTVRGHKLSVQGHAFRATLEADLNQDGRRDLLVVVQNERGAPVLASALADAEGLGTIELKSVLAGEGESCVVESAALSRLSGTFALIRMRLACGEGIALPAPDSAPTHEAPPAPPEPGEPPPAAAPSAIPFVPLTPQPLDVLVRIDGEPSIVERLHIDEAPPAIDPDQHRGTQVAASWSAGDVDADGHTDLTVQLTTTHRDAEPVSVAVHFLDRPSGLALDTTAIEKVWLAISDEAKLARKGQPDRAYTLASRVVWSHQAICRESGNALLELGGERGIPCGASLAAGRSGSIEAAISARRGQLLAAIARIDQLQKTSVYALTENDRERIRYAISERTKPVAWKPGPTVVSGAAPSVRRSAIAFLDEQRLLARSVQGAVSHELATGKEEPASAALADRVIRDPAGKRAISALATRCDGIHVTLVNAAQVVAGVVTGQPLSEPIVWPSAHSTAACEKQNIAFDDAPELQVIDWTRTGIAVAVSGVLWVVPIDGESVAASPLWPSAEALAEIGASSVGAASRSVPVPTASGLAIATERGSAQLFAWPDGVTRSAVSDVAVSASGKHAAVLAGGRVYFADLTELPPPPVQTPSAPSTPPAPPEPGHAP
jgi:hypothetical protein